MLTCTFEDGGSASLRHVTVNAIVLKDNKVLLGKRGTYNNGKPLLEAGKYGLLGGYFNREETMIECVKREVHEESGWEIDNLRLLRINYNPNRPAEDRQNIDIIFIADAVKSSGTSDEEVSRLEWFDLSALPSPHEVAFDHFDALVMCNSFLAGKIQIPVLG